MFWNKNDTEEPIIQFDVDNVRSAYRIEPSDNGNVSLLVNGERVRIQNVSANGIAFHLADACDPSNEDDNALQGILFIGHNHNPIPVELLVVSRQGDLLRCQISHQSLLAQKKLTAAIIAYQKEQIRTQTLQDIEQATVPAEPPQHKT